MSAPARSLARAAQVFNANFRYMKFGLANSYSYNCGSSAGRRAQYHPCTLVIDDLEEAVNSFTGMYLRHRGPSMFARKLDGRVNASTLLMDALDLRLRRLARGELRPPDFLSQRAAGG